VEEANLKKVSTISFIQANMQHSVAASRILARNVSGNGIDSTDTGTAVLRALYQGLEYSRIHPVLCWRGQAQVVHPGERQDQLATDRILVTW
jgi:hypothetical protein